MKRRVAVALLIGVLSVPTFAAPRRDDGDDGARDTIVRIARTISKIVKTLEDVRVILPLP